MQYPGILVIFSRHTLASDQCHVVRDIAFMHTCQKCCPVKIVCAPYSSKLYFALISSEIPWAPFTWYMFSICPSAFYFFIPRSLYYLDESVIFNDSIFSLLYQLFSFSFTVVISRNSNMHF